MRGRRAITRVPRVALLLESSTEYGRGLLRGIVRYSRLHGPWALSMMPGHLEQTLPTAGTWDGDGIIGRIRTPAMARAVLSSGLPFVASFLDEFTLPGDRRRYCQIRANSASIARIASTHLLERGLRQFGFCGFDDCPWSALREDVFAQCLDAKGFSCARYRIRSSPWMRQREWIRSWKHEQPPLSRWLMSLSKPVGIMACNDACGREVLEVCGAAQLSVPDEVAVIGVDNDELLCELSAPPLSSVALDLENAGYEAGRLLDSLMKGKLRHGRVVVVEPVLVHTRRSTDVIAADNVAVVKALRLIRDHAGRSINVGDVVDAVGTSRRTLERRFQEAAGRSILSEIARCRLERAKSLLLETELPCFRLGLEAGFSSTKAFNRAFRQAQGVSPKMFRQTNIIARLPGARSRRS
jgi:LacI family transcriptional regulator